MADLKTIIKITQEDLKKQVPSELAVQEAFEALSAREADVLNKRFGLREEKTQTLQEIGKEFGVTRERVRQIENQGIKKFAGQLTKKPLSDILTLAGGVIRERGGVISAESFEMLFLPESQKTPAGKNSLAFLLNQSPGITTEPDDKHFHKLYATSKAHVAALKQIHPIMENLLKGRKQPLSTKVLYEDVKSDAGSDGVTYLLSEVFIEAALDTSKDFVATPDDTWGLASWPEVNPRNIRDKTLYIMRRVGTPLHFTEITKRIEDAKFDHKKVTVQAVHNELINGDEFVLIGRGIYALGDWGYIPGTVADVIRAVLKKANGPVEREQIVKEVLKQRHVSRNTILINLQEKSSFSRVDKHSYALAR